MTAKSPAIITIRATARPRWRITWAERENERRRRAYDAEAEAWLRRDDELIRLQVEATAFLGCTQPRTGLPVDLDDDEVVFRVLPAAELVEAEARHVRGLPTPELTVAAASPGAAGRTLPKGFRVVDAGMAVVTNHRVAFAGRESRREWRYADMVGPAHHPEVPLTLLHTTDGIRLAGLLVPPAATVNFRFYLTLAFADATGERATVAAQLDALQDAHQVTRPVPPPPAEPDQAPMTAVRPGRRAVAITAVAAMSFATLTGAFGSEQAGVPYRADAGANVITASTDAPSAISPTAPTTPAEPVAPGRGTAASRAGAAQVRTTGGAPDEAAPTGPPDTVDGHTSVRPAVPGTDPASHPASNPTPTTAPAPITGPAPTTSPPSPEPSVVVLCEGTDQLLRLPLLQRLLCPPANL